MYYERRDRNMSKIGTGELLVILLVALLIFGPSRLPALGKMAGKAIGTVRHYANSDNWDEFLDDEDEEDAPVKSKKKKAKKAETEEEEEAEEDEEAEDEEDAQDEEESEEADAQAAS
jgi:TatA/E family protein of Tat protein translocase